MTELVILHMGPFKTGSTSIQGALSLYRKELAAAGIHYPVTTPPAHKEHNWLAYHVLEEQGKPFASINLPRLTWEDALAQAEESGAEILMVSSESFSLPAFDDEAFRHVRRKIGDRRLRVVLGLREPAATIRSMWNHAVMWNFGLGEERAELDEAVEIIAARPAIPMIPFVEQIERCCAPEEVRLFTVPPKADTSRLIRRFAEAARLPEAVAGGLAALDSPVLNVSPFSHAQARLLLGLNRALHEADSGRPSRLHSGVSEAQGFVRHLILEAMETDSSQESTRAVFSPKSPARLDVLRGELLSWLGNREVAGDLADLAEPSDQGEAAMEPVKLEQLVRVMDRALEAAYSSHIKTSPEISALREHNRALELSAEQLTAGRDWWKNQSDEWEKQLRSETARLLSVIDDVTRERDRLKGELEKVDRSSRWGSRKRTL